MLYEAKFRLLKAVLGSRQSEAPREERGRGRVFRLDRDSDNLWEQDLDSWAVALSWAVSELDLDLDVSTIRVPSAIPLGKTILFNRTYYMSGDPNPRRVDHEAVPKNYVLTYEIITQDHGSKKAPSREQLYKILCFVGKYEGLSEWGRERGFGRFKVDSLDSLGRGVRCLD